MLAVLALVQVVFLMVVSVFRTIFSARTSTGVVAAAVQDTLVLAVLVVSVAAAQEHSTLASVVTVSTGAAGVVAELPVVLRALPVATVVRTLAVAVAVVPTVSARVAPAEAVSLSSLFH